MSIFLIELGVKVKCKITGYKGTIISRTEWLTGCNTYGVKPPVDGNGDIKKAEYFDEGMLEVLPEEPKVEKDHVSVDKAGGLMQENIESNQSKM